MNRLAVLGASGHAKVVADAAMLAGWKDAVLFDDKFPHAPPCDGWPIEGTSQDLLANGATFDGIVVAIGDNRTRLARQRELSEAGLPIVSIIHPSAVVSSSATLDVGCVVCAGAVIAPATRIGVASIVNTQACVDHDCHLGAGVHISPAAALGGNVEIGEATWIGIGAVISHSIVVGANCIIGAGAAVIRNIESSTIAVGVPARAVHSRGRR